MCGQSVSKRSLRQAQRVAKAPARRCQIEGRGVGVRGNPFDSIGSRDCCKQGPRGNCPLWGSPKQSWMLQDPIQAGPQLEESVHDQKMPMFLQPWTHETVGTNPCPACRAGPCEAQPSCTLRMQRSPTLLLIFCARFVAREAKLAIFAKTEEARRWPAGPLCRMGSVTPLQKKSIRWLSTPVLPCRRPPPRPGPAGTRSGPQRYPVATGNLFGEKFFQLASRMSKHRTSVAVGGIPFWLLAKPRDLGARTPRARGAGTRSFSCCSEDQS